VAFDEFLRRLGPGVMAATLWLSPAQAHGQKAENATFLLPACQLYLRDAASGQRLRLERGVCIGVIETVLRIHRRLRAAYGFCPPDQVTLATAVRTVVEFARARGNLDRPLHELAIEAFQSKWPC
jgi:Rap1a immunity proteins